MANPEPPTTPAPVRPAATRIGLHALALAGYAAVAALCLRPIWRTFATHIAPDRGDPLFILYVLRWGARQLRLGFPEGLPGFWSPPFFFPAHGVLAYSDHMLGPAALVSPLSSPIAAYNLLFYGSFVLCGFTTWWVLRRSGLGALPAFAGGTVFAFSPFRWDQASHLTVLLAQWVPLLLWTWDRLLAERTWRRAGAFLAVYLLHASGGAYLAYMVHAALAALAANRAPALLHEARARDWRLLAVTALAAAALLVAFLSPYLFAPADAGLERSPELLRVFGATALSYVTPAPWNSYGPLWPGRLRRPENSLFAGFLPTALAVAGLGELWRRHRRPAPPLGQGRRAVLAALLALAAAALLLGDVHTWAASLGSFRRADPLDGYGVPLALLALGLCGWLVLWRRWAEGWPLRGAEIDPWPRGLLVAGLACLALSFPAVYAPLARLVPGLDAMRVPARFYAFLSFVVAFFAARGLELLLQRVAPARRRAAGLLAIALVSLIVAELVPRPLPWKSLPRPHELGPVHAWIAGRDDVRALLVLPMRNLDAPYPMLSEIQTMYQATRHWKPIVNGYSGHQPPHYLRLRRLCCRPAPEGEALSMLRDWGVTHLLVHAGDLRRAQRRRLWAWAEQQGIEQVYSDGHDVVFRIEAADGGTAR